MNTLASIEFGASYKIIRINAESKLLQKLLDMGFVEGAVVEVIRDAPLYDPIQLKIHDYIVTLRKSEAALIEVSKCD